MTRRFAYTSCVACAGCGDIGEQVWICVDSGLCIRCRRVVDLGEAMLRALNLVLKGQTR